MTALFPMTAASVYRPRDVARYLKSIEIDMASAWMALGAACCLSVILIFAINGFQPLTMFVNVDPFGPWVMMMFVVSTSAILIFGLFLAGRAMGGTGTLMQTVLIMAWLQWLQFLGQLVQVIVAILVPPLAGMLGLVVLGVLLYAFLNFLDVLHELGSLGRAGFLLLMALVGVSLGLTLILGLVGVGHPGGIT